MTLRLPIGNDLLVCKITYHAPRRAEQNEVRVYACGCWQSSPVTLDYAFRKHFISGSVRSIVLDKCFFSSFLIENLQHDTVSDCRVSHLRVILTKTNHSTV
jgi:hypothetical protein